MPTHLHILMLASSYPKYAGEATAPFIEEIAAGLVRRGHRVDVVLPFHPELRRAPVERGVRLHVFHYSPLAQLNVWGYAGALQGDVGLKGAALAVAPLALSASAAALWRQTRRGHSFDLIHAHWGLPNGPPAALVARARHLPLVVSLHGSDVYLAEKAAPLSALAAATFRQAGAITACSGDLTERALRLGAPPDRTEVIPYGVDTGAFQPAPEAAARTRFELGLAPDAPLVVSVSRLVHKKGLAFLIDAFPAVLARHPAATLVLGGYGDLRDELEQRVAALGIAARVRFPGQLSRQQAAALIGAANVYVVPSIHDQGGNVDGLPNVLLESMSAARPIVASRLAGIPDVIADGVHGLLVRERDVTGIADAIVRLLDNPGFAGQLGQAARRRVLGELTWDVAALRFEAAYLRALHAYGTR
jgi:glycosyltransferase involved in cell wall biosynthesis